MCLAFSSSSTYFFRHSFLTVLSFHFLFFFALATQFLISMFGIGVLTLPPSSRHLSLLNLARIYRSCVLLWSRVVVTFPGALHWALAHAILRCIVPLKEAIADVWWFLSLFRALTSQYRIYALHHVPALRYGVPVMCHYSTSASLLSIVSGRPLSRINHAIRIAPYSQIHGAEEKLKWTVQKHPKQPPTDLILQYL